MRAIVLAEDITVISRRHPHRRALAMNRAPIAQHAFFQRSYGETALNCRSGRLDWPQPRCRIEGTVTLSVTTVSLSVTPERLSRSNRSGYALALGLRGSQVLLIDGLEAMVVLHAGQRSIKINN